MPETEKTGFATLMELIESEMLPVLVRITDCEVEVFMVRVPKFTEAGEIASAGAAFSPSPESGTLTGAFRVGTGDDQRASMASGGWRSEHYAEFDVAASGQENRSFY